MKWIRQRVLNGELLAGAFLNIGSSVTAEIAGAAGLDWLVVDTEHGVGDLQSLLYQLQAIGNTPSAPIVRIACNEPPRFKHVLDLGASGVMVPHVNTAVEARQAAAAMRYPPQGIRGVAKAPRACGFGQRSDEYFAAANDNLLTVVQIETEQAVNNASEIAAVDGVDVLFIGPVDLGVSLGLRQTVHEPRFLDAIASVISACRKAGKVAGIVLGKMDDLGEAVEAGFTFIAVSSDGAMVANGMRNVAAAFDNYGRKR